VNYRHIYHAGNFADVFKHSILTLLIKDLLHKTTPFCYLDTHAGIGIYNLLYAAAQKTKEYESGIAKLLEYKDYPNELNAYLNIVKKLNAGNSAIKYYPGSPYIVRSLLRPLTQNNSCHLNLSLETEIKATERNAQLATKSPHDHMILLELHDEDILVLKQQFFNDKQVAVHHLNGYQGLKAFLPPKERRGLVLIDPSFEQPNEFDQIIAGLKVALERWTTGIYAIWYPIKNLKAVTQFKHDLKSLGVKNLLLTELMIEKNNIDNTFRGCGMTIINPPWKFDQQLASIIPWLERALMR
jgi:23S rRNA (adenine2030-N6)-methyltransferase